MPRVLHSNDPRIPENVELIKINDRQISDMLDYCFYNDDSKYRKFLILAKGKKKIVDIRPNENIHLVFDEPRYRKCENDCDYCFIKGLPGGLRKELYFQDDDYRLSFLFGNFISLTNLKNSDIKRIRQLRLSPLYISVHSTNPELRIKLYKNEKAGLIMEQLKKLVDANIQIHCQIVVIPGLTDGMNVENTINDLAQLFPMVCSVGVVPVGRTKFLRRIPVLNRKLCRRIVKKIMQVHRSFRKRFKKGFVYLADEFFIKSGLPIPGKAYYDDFCQYENGIGMVRQLIDEVDSLKHKNKISGKFLFITGRLAYPYINYLREKLINKKVDIDILEIRNRFFGDTVTVSGLLVGRDIHNAIRGLEKKYDRIILPPNCVNDNGKFLDDCVFNNRYFVAPYSIKELVLCLQ
ncbi:MAG: DUF512 domain-containing protein [candidate division WOR-3 bacterium]